MKGQPIRFEKWEGLGNDFLLVDDPSATLGPDVARVLCDRHFGVGGDGVLVVDRQGARPRMIVWNADGSRPEMCGNGLRCVASYLSASEGANELTLDTDAGERSCVVRATAANAFHVTVEMGVARQDGELTCTVDGVEHRFLKIDVGNPHAITFEAHDEAAIDRVGAAVAVAPSGGTNVEFCRVEADRIVVVVWERGVGRTLACGTGACAVAAAACDTGRATFGVPIRVALPGGELVITVAARTRELSMGGPARRVFTGEVVLA
ncbi:MAG: diaminopimelate epimerase [Byssovorax sp.]